VYSVHATKKLLERLPGAVAMPVTPTTSLGNWYANVLFWKPQVVIMVNEATLLPLLVPLAPARSLANRIPIALSELLRELHSDPGFVKHECQEMGDAEFTTTSNRSIVASMNGFARVANQIRRLNGISDPLTMARELSEMPCRLQHGSALWPIDEFKAIEATWLAAAR
jgi:hypothetical protein